MASEVEEVCRTCGLPIHKTNIKDHKTGWIHGFSDLRLADIAGCIGNARPAKQQSKGGNDAG